MFEKTLTDVVKGIRSSKRDTALYISQCIAEIKTEINSKDMFVKANALQKLTFLQMMGYSMSWASFATIEVMSSQRFAHKRVGYLAASQGFTQETEVVLLTTNLLKKELRGATGSSMHGVYEAGLAINCISNIVTEDLARDLLPELTTLTSHPQPYLRKKAILCLFKVFVKYPQGLRLTFDKIQQCLEDKNASVTSCSVNVITELSDKNPKNYLHLAPAFFQLLTSSSNNWMLIKVVKLLGSLVPEEPRLARKLLEPLASIVKNTQAKSLLYEAVHTITLCLPYCRKSDGSMPPVVPEIVTLCARTLRDFAEQSDQNLKYLGLVGFGSLMQSHPRVLSAPDYRPLILACLSDEDITIRSRALDLLTGMATRKNLIELVSQLLKHVDMASGSYKHDLVGKIVAICSGEKYALLQDFEWYLDVLFQIGHMRGVESHADLIRAQVTDVTLRVLPIRCFAVRRSIEILLERDGAMSDNVDGDNGRGKHVMPGILSAVAWIVGEYSDLIQEACALESDTDAEDVFRFDGDSAGTSHALVQVLTAPGNTHKLSPETQKIYLHAALKVFAAASSSGASNAEIEACLMTIFNNIPVFMQSTNVEVVERAFTALEFLKSLNLAVRSDGLPGLSPSDDEDAQDDLLGMVQASSVPLKKKSKSAFMESLADRVKDVSATLSHVLKPSPMKPSGAKAQRKKRDSAASGDLGLDTSVDEQLLQDLLEDEHPYKAGGRLSMQAVSFTGQRATQLDETPSTMGMGPLNVSSPVSSHDASISFQKSGGSALALPARNREGDPFYLDAAPATAPREDEESNRFGTIQLLDSDEEDTSKLKKYKKKKVKKTKRIKSTPIGMVSDSGLTGDALFGEASSDDIVVYGDDDDDDEEVTSHPNRRTRARGKEFAGLAKVDLTTPLREDEVMPERKHHVVSDKAVSGEKSKKKKTKKSKKSRKDVEAQSVGDLLDLGGFNSPSASVIVPSTLTGSAAGLNDNPVNSVFDDLLTLTIPTVPTENSLSGVHVEGPAPPVSTDSTGQQPWLRASIKSSSAKGGFDWSQIALLYRVYPATYGAPVSAMLVFQIDNSSSSALHGLCLETKATGPIAFGDVASGSSAQTAQNGPFAHPLPGNSAELKCALKCDLGSVSAKVSLPASLHLTPEHGVSLEHVAGELSSGHWFSQSIKISQSRGMAVANIKSTLCSFLNAAEVGDTTGAVDAFTLAALSTAGYPVRMLIKVKGSNVKVDVKSTNDLLCKALASDLKRVQF